MSHRYKLTFFNTRDKAEAIRYIFHQAGVQFEDERLSQEDWLKIKPTSPMGQLPILRVDDKVICQSITIGRFLAREFGLCPVDNLESARADMLVDGVRDQHPNMRLFIRAFGGGDRERGEELWKIFKSDHLPAFLTTYENFLIANGGEYFVGKQLTWADLVIAEMMDRLVMFGGNDETIFDDNKILYEHMKRIHNLPEIREYVSKRPKTLM